MLTCCTVIGSRSDGSCLIRILVLLDCCCSMPAASRTRSGLPGPKSAAVSCRVFPTRPGMSLCCIGYLTSMKFIIALLVQEVKRYVVISLILVYKCLKIKRKEKLISTFLWHFRLAFGSKNDTAGAVARAPAGAALSGRSGPARRAAGARGHDALRWLARGRDTAPIGIAMRA